MILLLIIIAFGALIKLALLGGLISGSGLGSIGFTFMEFNIILYMDLAFLVIPAVSVVLLRTKTVKLEISLTAARVLSAVSFILIAGSLILVSLAIIAQNLEPYVYSIIDVFLTFLILFVIEAALNVIVYWMSSRALTR
jgi:hypothetical protein